MRRQQAGLAVTAAGIDAGDGGAGERLALAGVVLDAARGARRLRAGAGRLAAGGAAGLLGRAAARREAAGWWAW